MANSIEWSLANAMRNALVLGLPTFGIPCDDSQVTISIVKTVDADWLGWPHFQVIPGAERPDGGGRGSQEGGMIERIQTMKVVVFTKLKKSQYSLSEAQVMDVADGELNLFEAIRQVFALTWLGNMDGSNCLLSEPMWYVGSSQISWENQETGLVSREFTWECQISLPLPNGITVYAPQVANEVIS